MKPHLMSYFAKHLKAGCYENTCPALLLPCPQKYLLLPSKLHAPAMSLKRPALLFEKACVCPALENTCLVKFQ